MGFEVFYLPVKHLHISLVLVSICLFCIRFHWSYTGAQYLNKKWVKVLPHCIDTTLLLCGIYLMVAAELWPNEQPWLLTKLLALIIYIILGSFAIKYSKTQRMKVLAGSAAILTFIYMVNVAISHNPFVFL